MKQNRLRRNIDLEEVSEATGISTGVLKILESDTREQFPAEVYTKGFYKMYAEFLGLNPDEILSAYQQKSNRPGKSRDRSGFNTVITLKGQEENLIGDNIRKVLVPIFITIGCVLLYWIYVNYWAGRHFLDFYR